MSLILDGTNGVSDIDGSASTPAIRGTDTNTGIFFPAADTIAFAEGGAEAMRLDSSGNLGIGTSSPTFSGGGGLQVKNSVDANVRITAQGFTGLDLLQQSGTGTAYIWNRDNAIMLFGTNNAERMRITSTGTIFFSSLASGAGTNALKWNTSTGQMTYDTSSARYKDNIRDSIYGLNHVMQMRSTQFEYKDDGRSDVGLIAEELQPIVPELVGLNKDGQADSVSYDRMVSVLIKAVQEQQEIITDLRLRIEALEVN